MMRAIFVAASAFLAGCSSSLQEVGVPPALSPVGTGYVSATSASYQYPQTPAAPVKRFSLWDDRQSRLFTDARALSPGDILTVIISINDQARFVNESERSRTSNRRFDLTGAYDLDGIGQEGSVGLDLGSDTESTGAGETVRSEDIELSVAAVVTDVLPNGNLIISGSQEVRVNAELRILTIAGIVRPIDIGARNTISYERIAEARISYGGRGRLTEVQQPAYGQQILDIISPF